MHHHIHDKDKSPSTITTTLFRKQLSYLMEKRTIMRRITVERPFCGEIRIQTRNNKFFTYEPIRRKNVEGNLYLDSFLRYRNDRL